MREYEELWMPAEELEEFNVHLSSYGTFVNMFNTLKN